MPLQNSCMKPDRHFGLGMVPISAWFPSPSHLERFDGSDESRAQSQASKIETKFLVWEAQHEEDESERRWRAFAAALQNLRLPAGVDARWHEELAKSDRQTGQLGPVEALA